MPKNVFDNDEDLLDYDAIDAYSALRIGDDGFTNVWPPPEADFLFHDPFERRAREINRQPNNLKPIQIVPQRRGPWSGNNQFGIEQAFAPNAQNRQTILKMPEWGFPQVWSVMLSVTTPTLNNEVYTVAGIIEAGVGGITDTFEIDWGNGTCFSVVANALNISAAYSDPSRIPSGLRLRVLVGRESLPQSAPRRSFAAVLAPAASRQFQIEKYTKSITLLPRNFISNPYAADFLLQFSATETSAVISEITGAQILNLGNGATVDLPGGANFINVVNNGAGPAATAYQLIYNLGL